MAEVATAVLHNVGNVLNSVNVSASLAMQHVRSAPLAKLSELTELLEQRRSEGVGFLIEDPKGKLIVPYLGRLAEAETQSRRATIDELDGLCRHVDHIKAIVAAQQSVAKTGGVAEAFPVRDVVEQVIFLNAEAYAKEGIELALKLGPAQVVVGDRHRLLQILTNLLSNARHAVRECTDAPRVAVRIRAKGERNFAIDVEDNGCGIPRENLTKVFTYGFTTRPGGHGFGLHGSACAAAEMGGRIEAHSDGPGQGAKFTVELPLDGDRAKEADGK
jgi:signal transduction histidine kinase